MSQYPDIAALEARFAALEAQLARATKPLSYEDKNALGAARAHADSVYQRFGEHAPEPLPGENPISYRKRLATGMQRHSPRLRGENLAAVPAGVLGIVEASIYAEAIEASKAAAALPSAPLIPIKSIENGLHVTRYHGPAGGWMEPFKDVGRAIRFRTEQNQ